MLIKAIKCPICHHIIYSRANHDYRECPCTSVAIDGGQVSCQRIIWKGPVGMSFHPDDVIVTSLLDVTLKDLIEDYHKELDEYGLIPPSKEDYLGYDQQEGLFFIKINGVYYDQVEDRIFIVDREDPSGIVSLSTHNNIIYLSYN